MLLTVCIHHDCVFAFVCVFDILNATNCYEPIMMLCCSIGIYRITLPGILRPAVQTDFLQIKQLVAIM